MTTCVLDADVVIAALDDTDAHHAVVRQSLSRMSADGVGFVLSLVNYAEAMVWPATSPETLRDATDAIRRLGVELIAPTPSIARDAARLRHSKLSLPDGFALATAKARSAPLATLDRRVRRVARQLGIALALR